MNIPKNCQTTPESENFYKKSQETFIKKHPLHIPLPYNIVSLGFDCSVRTILTDWGLKPTKQMGELSYPFDLAFCPHAGIERVLENDFKDFFDFLTFNKKTGLWENPQYCFFYNHDTDCTENDRQKFVERFQKRIHNFYKVVEDTTPIIFVAILGRKKTLKYIYRIFSFLKDKRQNKNSYLVLLSEKFIFFHQKDVFPIHIQKPFSGYEWWKSEMRYSLDGTKFEQKIATNFYKIIQNICRRDGIK